MKNTLSAAFSVLLALPLIFGAADNLSADDQVQNNDSVLAASVRDTDPLIGSWFVKLTNDSTKATNPALYSFLPGGVLNQSETPMTDPMLGNLVFSNAHGAWEYNAEDDSYTIRYFKLVYRADASYLDKEETTGKLVLDKDGGLSGTIRFANTEAQFSGDRISATDNN